MPRRAESVERPAQAKTSAVAWWSVRKVLAMSGSVAKTKSLRILRQTGGGGGRGQHGDDGEQDEEGERES